MEGHQDLIRLRDTFALARQGRRHDQRKAVRRDERAGVPAERHTSTAMGYRRHRGDVDRRERQVPALLRLRPRLEESRARRCRGLHSEIRDQRAAVELPAERWPEMGVHPCSELQKRRGLRDPLLPVHRNGCRRCSRRHRQRDQRAAVRSQRNQRAEVLRHRRGRRVEHPKHRQRKVR